MSGGTLHRTDLSAEWKAECPRCRSSIGLGQFTCFNCKSIKVAFCREQHGIENQNGHLKSSWTECGLMCLQCRSRYNTFPCPECRAVITIPCIWVRIRGLRSGGDELQSTLHMFTILLSLAASFGLLIATAKYTLIYVISPILRSIFTDTMWRVIAAFWIFLISGVALSKLLHWPFQKLIEKLDPELRWRPRWYRYNE